MYKKIYTLPWLLEIQENKGGENKIQEDQDEHRDNFLQLFDA